MAQLKRIPQTLGLLIVCSIFVLFLAAACSDDDESSSGGGDNDPKPQATATNAPSVDDDESSSGDGDNDPATEATATVTPSVVNVSFPDAGFDIILDVDSVPAGSVVFNVSTAPSRAEHHEFLVIRTDLAPDALPINDEDAVDAVDEDQVEIVGRIEEFYTEGGTTESATFDLEPGNYVLICNLVEAGQFEISIHYPLGERTAFTVTE